MTTHRTIRPLLLATLGALLGLGCGDDDGAVEEAPAAVAASAAEVIGAPVADAYPNEACIRGVLVSYQGALAARENVTRNKEDARSRADALHARVSGGDALADVARAEGDGGRAERGGQLGTFARAGWPGLHANIKDAVFALDIGGVSSVIEADYGYIFVERCPVEKANSRHILIRYAGALNASDDITRTREEAMALATDVRSAAIVEGGDFEALARDRSEDSSASRGGNLGPLGKGLLHAPYEEALFSLEIEEISQVVETPFGFHIIERIEMPTDS